MKILKIQSSNQIKTTYRNKNKIHKWKYHKSTLIQTQPKLTNKQLWASNNLESDNDQEY